MEVLCILLLIRLVKFTPHINININDEYIMEYKLKYPVLINEKVKSNAIPK